VLELNSVHPKYWCYTLTNPHFLLSLDLNMLSAKRNKQKRSRGGFAASAVLSRMVRAPPGTTTIVIPGCSDYVDSTLPIGVAFSIDSNTILATGSYINIANVYRTYRVKKITMKLDIPTASANTTGDFVTSLQYIQKSVQNPNPVSARQLMNVRPNKITKPWITHNWTWYPRTPDDYIFNLISDNLDYATVYAAVDNSGLAPGTATAVRCRFIAHVEFYGIANLNRSSPRLNQANPQSPEEMPESCSNDTDSYCIPSPN